MEPGPSNDYYQNWFKHIEENDIEYVKNNFTTYINSRD